MSRLCGALLLVATTILTACGGGEGRLTGRLAFASGPGGSDTADVFVVRADGTHERRLTRLPGAEFDASWSPDGKRLAYRDSRRGINENDDIYVMDADGGHRTNVSHNAANDWSPAWSPDGRWIAFASERGGLDIWRMRPDGSHQVRLTRGGRDEYPCWSPDGDRIAFMHLGDIWIVGADGSGAHALLTTVEEEGWPAWSLDGDKIAYVVGYEGSRTIWIVDADGTGRRALTKPGHDDMGVAWSPSGDRLVFSRDGVLTTMRDDGSDLHSLGVAGSLPAWSA
jgi:TolB protein